MKYTAVRISGEYRGGHGKHFDEHGVFVADTLFDVPSRHAGRWIRIALPPQTPSSSWNCDTRFIWAVHEEDARAIQGPTFDGCNHFLCEHALELD